MRCSYTPYISYHFNYRRPESPCLFKPACAAVKGFPCASNRRLSTPMWRQPKPSAPVSFCCGTPRVLLKCREHAGNMLAMACSHCVESCRQSRLVRLNVADASEASGRKIVKGTRGRPATATQRCPKTEEVMECRMFICLAILPSDPLGQTVDNAIVMSKKINPESLHASPAYPQYLSVGVPRLL